MIYELHLCPINHKTCRGSWTWNLGTMTLGAAFTHTSSIFGRKVWHCILKQHLPLCIDKNCVLFTFFLHNIWAPHIIQFPCNFGEYEIQNSGYELKIPNITEKNANKKMQITSYQKKLKTLWSLFMDGVQLPWGYRATTTRRQFTFYH